MTFSPVSSTCTPPGQTPASSHAAKNPCSFAHHVVEVAGLVAALVLVRVAVHRVADPQHGLAGVARRPQQRRERLVDPVGAHAAHQREPTGPAPGVELLAQREHLVDGDRGAELHADRVLDARVELHVRAVELMGALADPQQVRGAVVPLVGEACPRAVSASSYPRMSASCDV